jgi:preprotein translocase subunit SecY
MLRAFRDAFRIPDLQRKFLFTLLLLAVFRLGSYIPTPGINPGTIGQAAGGANGLLSLISGISGGNLTQFSIFALGVLPYITASIVIQILTSAVPSLEKLQKEGEEGRKTISQYTRVAAIVLGAIQALFLTISVVESNNGAFLLPGWEPGLLLRATVVLTQVAGIAFTLWIGERISEVGIGNGISLIIFAGIVNRFPSVFQDIYSLFQQGKVDLLSVTAFFALILVVIAGIVFIQQAERRIPVQYARKEMGGGRSSGGQATYLPIKVNSAGVIPVIFSSSLLTIPQLIASSNPSSSAALFIGKYLTSQTPTGLSIEILLIVGFTYLYNSIQFDPRRIAENLRESGGFIPGVRPGVATMEYLQHISSRITLWGAIFLGLLYLTPQLLQNATGIGGATAFAFSGTGLLIVVGVALDTLKQVEAQLTLYRPNRNLLSGGGRLRERL